MANVVVAPVAEADIESILAWTQEQFGDEARLRYAAILSQSLLDIAENPHLTGSTSRSEVASNVRTYHISNSRNHVDEAIGRVKKPRHVVLYRIAANTVQIGRVLHDSMDLPRHLPENYRA